MACSAIRAQLRDHLWLRSEPTGQQIRGSDHVLGLNGRQPEGVLTRQGWLDGSSAA